MRAIVVGAVGAPEVMEVAELPIPEPGAGQLRVRLAAAGVNFIDTYHRRGWYPLPLPFTPGLEGSGTVEAVGEGVEGFTVGDRVAWARAPGSYAEVVIVDAAAAVPVPSDVPLDVAAAIPLQGMTAHYLATDTHAIAAGERVLVHAGAGGVGRLLIQLAKLRGAEVFATVSTDRKAELARSAGADHVIRYDQVDFAEAVVDQAGARPLAVVYDGVGAATFDRGLGLLRRRGLMALFGQASGPVPPVDLQVLNQNGSLFVTRPTLFDYVATPDELRRRASDLFGWVAAGQLDVLIGQRYPLTEAVAAHRDLESRRTIGKSILLADT